MPKGRKTHSNTKETENFDTNVSRMMSLMYRDIKEGFGFVFDWGKRVKITINPNDESSVRNAFAVWSQENINHGNAAARIASHKDFEKRLAELKAQLEISSIDADKEDLRRRIESLGFLLKVPTEY